MSDIADLIFIFGAKYLYLFIIAIAGVWFLIQSTPRKKGILIVSCAGLPLVFVIFILAGRLYYNPRPFVSEQIIPLIHHAADNGFPSHHMLLVSVVATIVFLFSRRTGWGLWLLALWVGFSRVHVGVHHVIDIIGSMLISIVPITLVYLIIKYIGKLRIFQKGAKA